jgi:transposase
LFIIQDFQVILKELEGLRNELSDLRVSVVELENENQELRQENAELKRRLSQNSTNSSKPPSSDPLWDRSERTKKKRYNFQRKPGGQKGHRGYKLKRSDHVDHVIEHCLDECPSCKTKSLNQIACLTRQVLDIPPLQMEVTDHKFYKYQCSCCGHRCIDKKESKLCQEVQYGHRIKSLVTYLNVYQLIPYKRLVELIQSVFKHKISQGSISNFTKGMSDDLDLFINELKQGLTVNDEVINSDETGIVVDGQLKWAHVYSNTKKTYLAIHDKRGCEAIDQIGILPKMKGILIHDRFGSYFQYENVQHGLCNAHILRDIKASQENDYKPWLSEIKKILLYSHKAKTKGKLKKNSVKFLKLKYERILRTQRNYYHSIDKQHPNHNYKKSLDHKLYNALWKHRHKTLLFLENKNVPFDNNQAERDLRMLKVKTKISNIFKSNYWAQIHLNIRSYISTLQKNNLDILDGLTSIQKDIQHANQLAV